MCPPPLMRLLLLPLHTCRYVYLQIGKPANKEFECTKDLELSNFLDLRAGMQRTFTFCCSRPVREDFECTENVELSYFLDLPAGMQGIFSLLPLHACR